MRAVLLVALCLVAGCGPKGPTKAELIQELRYEKERLVEFESKKKQLIEVGVKLSLDDKTMKEDVALADAAISEQKKRVDEIQNKVDSAP